MQFVFWIFEMVLQEVYIKRKDVDYQRLPFAVLYPERDLNPHSCNSQRILSPSCLPFHHSSILSKKELKTRLELATLTLARLCSTNWAISAIYYVKRRRLELPRHNCHYPLKVARLPIPPFLQKRKSRAIVPRTGLEPACLSTHAPETCASTIPPPGHSV